MKRYLCQVGFVLAAVTLSLGAVADSRADLAVSGQIYDAELVNPPDVTFTPGGIVILRNWVTNEFLDGDLAGTMRVTLTLIVNDNTGEGILFGTIDLPDPGSDGGFRGSYLLQVSGVFGPGEGEFDGTWKLHGCGTHQGETAIIRNYGSFSTGVQFYEGVIHEPGP